MLICPECNFKWLKTKCPGDMLTDDFVCLIASCPQCGYKVEVMEQTDQTALRSLASKIQSHFQNKQAFIAV